MSNQRYLHTSPPATKKYQSSLIHRSNHPNNLLEFLRTKVTTDIIMHLAATTRATIDCDDPVAMKQIPPATPPASPDQQVFRNNEKVNTVTEQLTRTMTMPMTPDSDKECTRQPFNKSPYRLPNLEFFISSIVDSSHVQLPTLICTLVVLKKLGLKLPSGAKGLPCTRHRVFLACLVLSAKYNNDCAPHNKHWARYASQSINFSLKELSVMERQALMLLDFRLSFTQEDLIEVCSPFLKKIPSTPVIAKSRTSTPSLPFRKSGSVITPPSITSQAGFITGASLASIMGSSKSFSNVTGLTRTVSGRSVQDVAALNLRFA